MPTGINHLGRKIDFNLTFLEMKVLKKIMCRGFKIDFKNMFVNKVPIISNFLNPYVFLEQCPSLQVSKNFHDEICIYEKNK